MESNVVALIVLTALRAIAWTFFLAPLGVRRGMATSLGWALRRLRVREGVVHANLKIAFPDSPGVDQSARRHSLAREAYRHLAYLVFEIAFLFENGARSLLRRAAKEHGELRGLEHWRAAHALGKGVFFCSSHVGNWEIMAAIASLYSEMDLVLVTKRMKPTWFHQAIERGRATCRVKGTYEPRTMRDVLGHLKKGGTVGFVLDQYAGPPVCVRVPVFGVPVGTSTALAMLAKRTGAPVLTAVSFRDEKTGRWVVEFRPPVQWETREDPHEELAVNTARFAKVLEADILRYPEQWLWIHRRFKGDMSPLRDGEWRQARVRRG